LLERAPPLASSPVRAQVVPEQQGETGVGAEALPEVDIAAARADGRRENELAAALSGRDLMVVPRFGSTAEADRGEQFDVPGLVDRSHPHLHVDAVLGR